MGSNLRHSDEKMERLIMQIVDVGKNLSLYVSLGTHNLKFNGSYHFHKKKFLVIFSTHVNYIPRAKHVVKSQKKKFFLYFLDMI
jgi:hypothetical protein